MKLRSSIVALSSLLVAVLAAMQQSSYASTYFQASPEWSLGQTIRTYSVVLGDIDADGDLDLVCGNAFGQPATLYLNEGSMLATTPSRTAPYASYNEGIALGDAVARNSNVCGCPF